jgi:hypothetical protein
MSEETLRQKIAEKGYELLGFKNEDEKCYNFNNKNNQQVNIKFKCGHEKTVRISSICCKVLVCVPCKNLQKYNYNLKQEIRLVQIADMFIKIMTKQI